MNYGMLAVIIVVILVGLLIFFKSREMGNEIKKAHEKIDEVVDKIHVKVKEEIEKVKK